MTDLSQMSDDELMALYRKAKPAPKLSPQEQQSLADARQAAKVSGSTAEQANEFLDINRTKNTGGWRALPGASNVLSALDSDYGRMDSITARLAPQQREPGSGASSDKDVAGFRRSVPNLDYKGSTNRKIVDRLRTDAADRAAYAAHLDRWARENGTLMGAAEAWSARKTAPKATGPKALPQKRDSGSGWKVVGVD